MRTHICIEHLKIRAYHGVAARERRVGNDFEVSVKLFYDASEAMRTDRVASAINYADVAEEVRRQMAIPSALLEHIAGRIQQALVKRYGSITGGVITITKLRPPVAGAPFSASFTVEW
jgi:dihydroneopterin aldolase